MRKPTISRERFWMMTALALALLLFIGGSRLPESDARENTDTSLYDNLKIFTDVLAIVQRDYVREVDPKKLVEGAIKGMLAQLDPHSGYLDPDFYQDLQVQTKGEFGGLGIEITIKDGLLVVVSPMEGSPAEKAGIRAGDSIVKIDGRYTKEYSLVDAVKKLRGPKGSSIAISVMRKGSSDLIDVTVMRDTIEVKSVRGRYLGENLGYVRLSQFMEKTFDDLKAEIEKMRRQCESGQLRGLVLDLRNNPGGLLTQAIKVSDLWLTDGVIVYTDGRVESQKQKFFAHARDTEPNYPLVIIINGGSASASEIVAGAMQDHGRALILGTQSFGKGSVQTITPLENNGAITLTTALYYTKSGRSIQVTGVRPDIEIDNPVEPVDPKKLSDKDKADKPIGLLREGDLPGAISNPNQGDEKGLKKINKTPTIRGDLTSLNPEHENLSDWLKRDLQLQRAIDLLKSFNIFKGTKEPSS